MVGWKEKSLDWTYGTLKEYKKHLKEAFLVESLHLKKSYIQ
jgi:hypothetical protein